MTSNQKQRSAFERQIEAARPALIRRARRRLNESEVDDAVQDALVIALSKTEWAQIRKPTHWVLGIMDHVIVATVRKRRYPVDDYDVEQAKGRSNPCDDLVETICCDEELTEKIAEIIAAAAQASLTQRESHVFYARLTGISDAETAQALGIGCNAVRSYFSLAVKKIKTTLVSDDVLEPMK